MVAKKTGRPPTGWTKYRDGSAGERWYTMLTLSTGKRSPWIPLPKSIDRTDEAGARAEAKRVSDDAREGGLIPNDVTETVTEYSERWIAARTGQVRSVRDNSSHLENHILPVLGPLAIAKVTRSDIETFVAALDAKVDGGLDGKTAKNIWGTCSKMFDDATNAKAATGLRCLATNPVASVRGPDDDGPAKALQFLYPSEAERYFAHEDVPRRWKRFVAIAIYLCLRDGEFRALKWSSVDLEHGIVTIRETYDRGTKQDRDGTKGGKVRMVPIRPELLPLLQAMHKESGGKGYVCKLPRQDMAGHLRKWLMKAGVDRDPLHKGTSVSRVIRWHDIRATGATWLAVEGRGPTEIRDIMGHEKTEQTDVYMRNAAVLRGGRFGRPFPPLPPSVVGGIVPRGFRSEFSDRSETIPVFPLKTADETGRRPVDSTA